MRRYILNLAVVFLALAAISCGGGAEKPHFTINGEIKGADKGVFILTDASGERMDSLSFEGGKFTCKGTIDKPQKVIAYIANENKECLFFVGIFLGNEEVVFQGDTAGFMTHKITSKLHNEYEDYTNYVKKLNESSKMTELRREGSDSAKAQIRELKLLVMKKVLAYKENGERNQIAAAIVAEMASGMSLEDQIFAASLFPKDFTDSYYLNALRTNIEREQRLAIGALAPDFKLKDLNGKEYTRDSFKGKYLYMDFSASWCGWCKKEIPFIREAYNKLKDKDIVFVTINMDENRELWEGDVKAENIEWLCLSDLCGMKSELAKSYNIHGIPAVFVLDPQGKILVRNIRQAEMVEYLTKLFD